MNHIKKEITQISKEQTELLRIEQELNKAINKIKENLNQLLVEELQLKSYDVEMITSKNTTTMANNPNTSSHQKAEEHKPFSEDMTETNKQTLNLDVKHLFQHLGMVEEDEDD